MADELIARIDRAGEKAEALCSIALTLCQGIGHRGAKRLIDELGSAEAVFRQRRQITELIPDATSRVAEALDDVEAFERACSELEFAGSKNISCLTLQDEAYPLRLKECPDAPVVLFHKGAADLNRRHVLAMVGTRRATDYGRQFCAAFLRDMAAACPDVLVVSGLAYGIDIHAHRAALAEGLPTVGVLAHGLDRIYPHPHRQTAVEMLAGGGLLTEFLSQTTPEPFNFVQRNRIVAGMSDAVLVVESAAKGGALITADLAVGYGRDCFAVPGRTGDMNSVGCNQLIRDSKAGLVQDAGDLLNAMGWQSAGKKKPEAVQRELFADLTGEELKLVSLLQQLGDAHVNTLVVQSGIPVSKMSMLLFGLEMKGVVRAMVGGLYRLLS